MLADLFHVPEPAPGGKPCGTATVGSSEAILLAVLAFKTRWQDRRAEAGLPPARPQLVMGHNTQVCWEKACRYFEVDPVFVDLSDDCFVLTPEAAIPLVTDCTIAVVAMCAPAHACAHACIAALCILTPATRSRSRSLGSTYNGQFEDVAGLDAALAAHNATTGLRVPIHVDAASGGMVAPFAYPDLKWDFQLSLVDSINVSGHKYGLVYPGLGWLLFRDRSKLPDSLVFKTHYLVRGSSRQRCVPRVRWLTASLAPCAPAGLRAGELHAGAQ